MTEEIRSNNIKLFNNHSNYQQFQNLFEKESSNVSLCFQENEVHYNNYYSSQYLTFEALQNGTFQFTKAINYSIDGGTTWVALAANTATPTITTGNKIMWKAELTPDSSNYEGIGTFSSTGNFNVEGNTMSLLYGDNFIGQTNLTGKDYAFYRLFYNCSKLINAKNISLPATTLANFCYTGMFIDCTSLTTAPKLPATTLVENCYNSMFSDCTALTIAPELPATTLAYACYNSMFYDCAALTTAPELPATTLAEGCYTGMFTNCISLTTAPELPATTLANDCYVSMFECCTSLTTAPDLPATILVEGCYNSMFDGCTNLNYIKAMFTTTPDGMYTDGWVNRVAATGTFIKNSAATWNVIGTNGIPEGWTVYNKDDFESVQKHELDLASSIVYPSHAYKTFDKVDNNIVRKVCIPVSNTCVYSFDDLSTNTVKLYKTNPQSNDLCLALKLGGLLTYKDIITDAKLICTDYCSYINVNIIYDNNNDIMKIYSELPLDTITDINVLVVAYYNTINTNNILYLWFDDYPSDTLTEIYDFWAEDDSIDFETYAKDYLLKTFPSYHNCRNIFKYLGETYVWNNKEYYMWELATFDTDYELDPGIVFILTDTIDYNELYCKSLKYDINNMFKPYVVKVTINDNFYTNTCGDILIDVATAQDMWAYYNGYSNWSKFVESYLLNSNTNYGNSNCYEYIDEEPFIWNNKEYYLYKHEEREMYILLDTTDYNTLYNQSMEVNTYNTICPYVAIIDDNDHILYTKSERQNDWLIKVENINTQPTFAYRLYLDDFNTINDNQFWHEVFG